MRRLIIGAVLVAALAAAGSASAGGWATAGLAPPPDGIGPGETWNAEVTILQHGRTPLSGVEPTVRIVNDETGASKTFAAKPTGKPGVYEAEVVFPAAGTWRYEVWDGFTQYGGAKAHTFGPVTIGGEPVGGGSSVDLPAVSAGIVAVLAAAALVFIGYRRRPRTAPAA